MRKILFYLIFISALSNAQTTGKSCSECIPSTSGVPNDYVLTNNSGIPTWQAGGGGGTNYWTSSGGNIYNNTGTNVGIGNSTPTHTLELGQGGVLNATYFQTIGSDGNDFVIYSYPQDAYAFRINGDDSKILFDEGQLGWDVGIGVSNPNVTLDVTGDFQFVTGNQGAGKVWTSDADGFCDWQSVTNTAWGLTGNSGTDPNTNFIGTTDYQDLHIKRNGNTYVEITADNKGQHINIIDSVGNKLFESLSSDDGFSANLGSDTTYISADNSTGELDINSTNVVIRNSNGYGRLVTQVDSIFNDRDTATYLGTENFRFKEVNSLNVNVTGVEKISSEQTTVNASTSGTVIYTMPQQGASLKMVIIRLNAAVGTASYTFPTPFTYTPGIVVSSAVASGIVTSLNTTGVTVTGATTTGFLYLMGF